MELRPHQIDCVNTLRVKISQGAKRLVVKAPCSFGKTIVFCDISEKVFNKNKRVLIIVDSIALVTQTFDKMKRFVEEYEIGIYCASLLEKDCSKLITISTIQSIKDSEARFDLIIVDEAHDGIIRINGFCERANNKDCIVIGFTATPYNAKGIAIYGEDKFYKELAYEISVDEMVEKKYICPMKYGTEKDETKIDLKKIRITGDDFNEGDLQELYDIEVDKVNAQIIDMISRIGVNDKTIIMCTGIKHADFVASKLPNALSYHSEISNIERKDILKKFEHGDHNFLVGVMAIYKGLDIPCVKNLVNMRPTRSKSFFVQFAGRGVRTFEGKTHCNFLDYGQTVEFLGCYEDITETKKKLQTSKAEPQFFPKKCPECYTLLRPQIMTCDCGYEFVRIKTANLVEESFVNTEKKDKKVITFNAYEKENWNVIAVTFDDFEKVWFFYTNKLAHMKKVWYAHVNALQSGKKIVHWYKNKSGFPLIRAIE